MKSLKISSLIITVLFSFVFCHCAREDSRVSTREDRAELFDYIIEKTKEREAFSPVKNKNLNFDPVEEMMKFREEMIAAETDEALFDVLIKISNARRDRHLSISPVEGGIQVNDSLKRQAPLIFRVDFSTPGDYFFFVGDLAENMADYFSSYGISGLKAAVSKILDVIENPGNYTWQNREDIDILNKIPEDVAEIKEEKEVPLTDIRVTEETKETLVEVEEIKETKSQKKSPNCC